MNNKSEWETLSVIAEESKWEVDIKSNKIKKKKTEKKMYLLNEVEKEGSEEKCPAFSIILLYSALEGKVVSETTTLTTLFLRH